MYYDANNKKLYFYPIKTYGDDDNIKIVTPKAGLDSILHLSGCSNVIINGITFRDCSAMGIVVAGPNNVVQNCTFENITSWSIIHLI